MKKDLNFTYRPLLKEFLDLSLSLNKNVITEELWNINCIFPFLNIIKYKLCFFCRGDNREQSRRKEKMLEVFEDLLKATTYENDFTEEKLYLYNYWFKKELLFLKDENKGININ